MFIEVDKTDEQITADILQNLDSKYQKSVGFFAWDYARAIAIGGFKQIYSILKYICSLGDIHNFEYNDLVKFVRQRRGIVARTATKAIGSLVVTGTGTINKGDLFQTQAGMQFQATETKTITNTGIISIEAVVAGVNGNVPENTITVIPVTIMGIVSITNPNAMTGGFDDETKDSIIERYLEDLQKPITSNNVYHYNKWAKEVSGVGNCKIKPLWNGDNTVKIVIVNSDNELADNALVNSVQKYIDPFGYKVTDGTNTGYVQNYVVGGDVPIGTPVYIDYDLKTVMKLAEENEFSFVDSTKYGWGYGNGEANVGAYSTVISADAKDIDITVDISLREGAILSEVKTQIEAKINEYFKTTVFNDPYISYARIGASILSVEGVLDYDNLLVNSDTDNIPLVDTNASTEIAVLDSITITEV